VFTADLFDAATLACVVEHGVPVNAGSIDMLHQLGARIQGPCGVAAHQPRLWPWPQQQDQHRRRAQQARHLAHRPAAGAAAIRSAGLKLVGLHMHIGSGVDYGHLSRCAAPWWSWCAPAHAAGHDLHAISAGGGLSIPYRAGDPVIDTQHYFGLWDAARQQAEAIVGHPLGLEIEPGRFLVAESGVLLGEVRATKMRAATTLCWSIPASTS
jgi:diaminopimelate decarboxylase